MTETEYCKMEPTCSKALDNGRCLTCGKERVRLASPHDVQSFFQQNPQFVVNMIASNARSIRRVLTESVMNDALVPTAKRTRLASEGLQELGQHCDRTHRPDLVEVWKDLIEFVAFENAAHKDAKNGRETLRVELQYVSDRLKHFPSFWSNPFTFAARVRGWRSHVMTRLCRTLQ